MADLGALRASVVVLRHARNMSHRPASKPLRVYGSDCDALAEAPRRDAQALLERHGCWAPLWRVTDPQSGHDPDGRAPFARGISVF